MKHGQASNNSHWLATSVVRVIGFYHSVWPDPTRFTTERAHHILNLAARSRSVPVSCGSMARGKFSQGRRLSYGNWPRFPSARYRAVPSAHSEYHNVRLTTC